MRESAEQLVLYRQIKSQMLQARSQGRRVRRSRAVRAARGTRAEHARHFTSVQQRAAQADMDIHGTPSNMRNSF